MALRRLFHSQLHRSASVAAALVATLAAFALAWPPVPLTFRDAGTRTASASAAGDVLGKLPVHLIENQGQVDPRVAYYVEGRDRSLYFTDTGLTLALTGPADASGAGARWAVRLDFEGATPVRPVGTRPSSAAIHSLRGNPESWRTDLKMFNELRYANLWPGVDLVYEGEADQLKYEFVVQPGADPNVIALAYRGATSVEIADGGDLVVSTPVGSFRDEAPYVYQDVDGHRIDVPAAYSLEARGEGVYAYGIALGAYDRSLPLVIDPVVAMYAGFVGGGGREDAVAVAVDGAGYAYIAGTTIGSDTSFPTAVGPDTSYNGGADVFVAKVRLDGTGLVYAGFIGGISHEEPRGIAVDGAGHAYVTGYTFSADFPTWGGPSAVYGGAGDAFIAKLALDGSGLVYSGFIGGSGVDDGFGVAVDGTGSAYIAGATWSNDGSFPTAIGPSTSFLGGNGDGFVARVAPDGSRLLYSGFIGGVDVDEARAVAVDVSGNAYVTGYTLSTSPGFTTTVGPDTSYNGGGDAFVVKVRADGVGLLYGGYIGGSDYEEGRAIAVDEGGHAYVTGYTLSTQATFPARGGPDLTANGGGDTFVAKVATNGADLVYAGFVGGSGFEQKNAIAVGMDGSAYVIGSTWSPDFPAIGTPRIANGGAEAVVARVAPNGSTLLLATSIGGDGDDLGHGVALDRSGSIFLAGSSNSTDASFPVRAGPARGQHGGDAFVARLALLPDLSVQLAGSTTPAPVGLAVTYALTVTNLDTIAADATGVAVTIPLPSTVDFVSAEASQGSCGLQGAGVVCALGTMTRRATATITLRVTPRTAGTLRVAASVAAAGEDADVANNQATISTKVRVVACTPRPPVTVAVAPGARGELVATITATTGPGAAINGLRAITLGAPVNARVDVGGQVGLASPTTVPLPDGTQQTRITVRRERPGQPVTVPLAVVDECGEWPTMVGGGPTAF